jgi:hypothetical protein
MEPLKVKISKTHFQIRRTSKTPTDIAQPPGHTYPQICDLASCWRISIKVLRSQIEVDHVENSSNPNSNFLGTPLSLSLTFLPCSYSGYTSSL